MVRWDSLRARFAFAAIAVLAGCSSYSQVTPPAGDTPQSRAHAGVRLPATVVNARGVPLVVTPEAFAAAALEAGRKVPAGSSVLPETEKSKTWSASVFVSDAGGTGDGAVYQFTSNKKGKLLGSITDVVNPQGMDSDSNGNLWVASTGNSTIRAYPPGVYKAATVLSDPDEFPVSVAVCPNGTVYGSNAYDLSFLPGNIVIYSPGSTSPTGTVPDGNIYSATFVACDANNVLWYDYLDYTYNPNVASYNGTTVTEYGSLGLTPNTIPGGIRAGKNGTTLAIADQGAATIDLFTKSNPAAGPYATLKGLFSDPVSFSFIKSQSDVWVADDAKVEALEATLKGKVPATVGSGTLVQPIDAYAFPTGNT
jgi:hypothetical protein